MNEPMVSVVVCTYQHVDFIRQCLDSILMQKTNFPFEIILGEDESMDGTREICQHYAYEYPEVIRLFLRSRKDVIYINGNATGRFNFVENLKVAKGKYIALCEGDDYWTDLLKLQKQFDFMEHNSNYSICFHNVGILEEGKIIKDYFTNKVPETTSILQLAHSNYIHTASIFYRTDALQEIPEYFYSSPVADYFLTLLLSRSGLIKCIDEVMGIYRIHKGSYWSSKKNYQQKRLWIDFLKKIMKYFNDDVKIILLDHYYRKCFNLFKYNPYKYFNYFLKCMKVRPLNTLKKGIKFMLKIR